VVNIVTNFLHRLTSRSQTATMPTNTRHNPQSRITRRASQGLCKKCKPGEAFFLITLTIFFHLPKDFTGTAKYASTCRTDGTAEGNDAAV